jgi:hypothetical protein
MPEVPTFFFSHARQDWEAPGKYLEKFFEDLVAKVAQFSGVDLKVERVGTIDKEVLQGADWDRDLSEPLGKDKVFVAIMTPVYFNRENCGKELYGFLLRSQNLALDPDGALTDVQNILPIRWLTEEVYYANTQKDSRIPVILRRINDTPADNGDDPDRTKAIERYRKKGMEKCVTVEPHYGELLDLFALRIVNLATLPPAKSLSFSTLTNAFTYDWKTHLGASSNDTGRAPAQPLETVEPRILQSVVVFYMTDRPFLVDPNRVSFADQLIAEPTPEAPASTDPSLAALFADVRAAALAEGFNVFHAASQPLIPSQPETLVNQLESLNEQGILTALVIDGTVWPKAPTTLMSHTIQEIIRSSSWTGPVLLPSFGEPLAYVERLVQDHALPPRLVALPEKSEERVPLLRRAFVDARGRMLTMSKAQQGVADPLPILKGVVPENT